MSDFTDGPLNPDYEGSQYTPLELLDPEAAFDGAEEIIANYYVGDVISQQTVHQLQRFRANEDPRLAALGHLGLANVVNNRLANRGIYQQLETGIIPPNYLDSLVSKMQDGWEVSKRVGALYELTLQALQSDAYDSARGALSTYLWSTVWAKLQRQSYYQPMASPGDHNSFGNAAQRLFSFYKDGYLEPDTQIGLQATEFDCGVSNSEFNYEVLSGEEEATTERVTRFNSLRNMLLHPMGEELPDEAELADEASLVTQERSEEITNARQIIKQLWNITKLSERQRTILSLRFGFDGTEPKTLQEIGVYFGLTRERVRQIESDAMYSLRSTARAYGISNDIE